MEVVWCFFDCTVKGVEEGGVERSEREFGNDMGEVECCTDDQISWTSKRKEGRDIPSWSKWGANSAYP
jgi:hypothetical protein